MYSSSAYFAIYCAAALCDFPIVAIISRVMCVLMEMSTVVTVILCHGAQSTMCTASGSHQKLNSRRLDVAHSICTTGEMLPPIATSSCVNSGTCGSMLM